MNNDLRPITTLPPFKRMCMTIGELPTSYLETMTYYEMLVWFTEYMKNTIIPTINNNGLAVEELQNKYIEFSTSITNQQNTYEEYITGLFNELQSFVDNYFDNLDVQEEINNKLDEMAESGELTDIIAQYLGLAGMLVFNNVNDMKQATNLVNGSTCQTLGYYQVNDGGEAIYKIRNITNEDIIDNARIVSLNNINLVGELIINEYIKPKQFGCYANGINDDSINFKKCIDYALISEKPILIDGTIVISSSYDLIETNKNLIICGHSTSGIRSTQWHHGSGSRIKLINGSSLLSGTTYYNEHSAIPWLKLNLSDINFFNEYTEYNENYNNQFIINNIRLTSSIIDNISSECLNFMKGSFNRTSILKNSHFIACYIFMQRGSEGDMISDSVISDNYISGSNTGYVFDKHTGSSVRFTNNFVDYFKYIFSPTVTGNSFLSSGNIYDNYFQIFEPTDNVNYLYANFISVNDKFNPHNRTFCENKGWLTSEQTKRSIPITGRSFNLQFINSQIREPDGDNGDDVFIYGHFYGPTSKVLTIKVINPTFWDTLNSYLTKVPNITQILNVVNEGASLEQHFNNCGLSYQPSIIDRVSSLPPTQRSDRYILPPFYTCYNTTDSKRYIFDQTGSFVEV